MSGRIRIHIRVKVRILIGIRIRIKVKSRIRIRIDPQHSLTVVENNIYLSADKMFEWECNCVPVKVSNAINTKPT